VLSTWATRRAETHGNLVTGDPHTVGHHEAIIGGSHSPSMPHRHLVAYGEAMGDIKLGYNTGYWSAGPPAGALEAVKEAERLGFNSVWTAEAYGSDALTPLAWWGAATETLQLGTAIMQMSARTPAATAMAAITMDHLSNGRFILGVGASGPQVVEGWYGQPYPKPLARTREYVEIVRSIVARDKPVEFHGEFYDMPFQGGAGLGKALKSTVHPLRTDIPIYLAAEGPKNVALSAEICDGWLPLFFSPKEDKFYRDCHQQGFDASGDPTKKDRFEVTATAMIIPGDDVEKCADLVRPFLALYAGGMGAKGANFHYEVFARMGYGDVADKVQALYLDGKKAEAAAAIPLAMVEDVALVGPPDKIRDELAKWRETCITEFLVSGPAMALPSFAELVLG
jgi:F420-dependent oxidoreductase-like protein